MRSEPDVTDCCPDTGTKSPGKLKQDTEAWNFCQGLAETICSSDVDPGHLGLAAGVLGPALFLQCWHVHSGDLMAARRAHALAEVVLDRITTAPVGLGFLEGLTGISWGIRKLLGDKQHLASDFSAELDGLLAERLAASSWPGDFDLVSGLVGIGLYAIEHPDPKWRESLTSQVLWQLRALSENTSAGTTWLTRPELLLPGDRDRFPTGYHNLGVAHGVPGVIGFLARCIESKCCVDQATHLLVGAVTWLLAQTHADTRSLHAHGGTPAFSPSIEFGKMSRPTWCYGDLGICVVMFRAAMALGRSDWVNFAIEVAHDCAGRREPGTRVKDMGLCHGTVGIALMFFRLWQQTGDPVFADASSHWVQRTLKMRVSKFRQSAGVFAIEWIGGTLSVTANMGYLGGAAGVGLAVLTCITGDTDRWDTPLLTDLPVKC